MGNERKSKGKEGFAEEIISFTALAYILHTFPLAILTILTATQYVKALM